MPKSTKSTLIWHRVLSPEELPEGRVKTVAAGHHSFAVTHFEGRYAALSNRCPHQGGPLGEGSIEKGMLRCPWHGYDYCPLTGESPFGDSVPTFPVQERDDGIYVGVEPDPPARRDGQRRDGRDARQLGRQPRLRHGRPLQPRPRRRFAPPGSRLAGLTYIGIRHEGAAAFAASAYGKLTGRPAACLTIAGPGATNLLTGLWDAKVDRAPVVALTGQVDTAGARPGRLPGGGPRGRVRVGRGVEPDRPRDEQARRADDAGVQARDPSP